MQRVKRFIGGVVDFFNGIGEHKLWSYAAAATFYMFLSLIPIIGLVCAILPYTPLTQDFVLYELGKLLPASVEEVFTNIVEHVYEGPTAVLPITAIATIWSAGLSVQAIMRGMDDAYDLKRKEGFLLFRLRACAFIVIILAAVLATLCAIVYGGMILDLIQSTLKSTWAVEMLFTILKYGRYVVMMLILFVVFELSCKWMPTGKRKLMRQWPGALFTTVAWLVFSWGFSLYVSFSDKYGIYGILGTVVVAMLWMYYCAFFILAGGYINHLIELRRESSNEKVADAPETLKPENDVPQNTNEADGKADE